MNIAVPGATGHGECRVALIPETCSRLHRAGLHVLVQTGAGIAAGFPDSAYETVAAEMVDDVGKLCEQADALVMVQAPSDEEIARMKAGAILLAVLNPLVRPDLVRSLARHGIRAIAMDMMPRISRAQRMDVLSSMSTVAGYKAVLLAATELGKMFPLMMTAAGTVTPARVLVLGAGVAGLQAIATARRLGALVEAFDVRPAVKEQVESLGARFVEVDTPAEDAEDAGGYAKEMSQAYRQKQKETLAKHVAGADIVISTALIPGKPAPVLITEEMVQAMAPGSVIMDLAAEAGGNCPLTRADQTVVEHGVKILGPTNLPATIPYHASQMYSRNVGAFLQDLIKDGEIVLDQDDECVAGTLITENGEVVNGRVREAMETTTAATE